MERARVHGAGWYCVNKQIVVTEMLKQDYQLAPTKSEKSQIMIINDYAK